MASPRPRCLRLSTGSASAEELIQFLFLKKQTLPGLFTTWLLMSPCSQIPADYYNNRAPTQRQKGQRSNKTRIIISYLGKSILIILSSALSSLSASLPLLLHELVSLEISGYFASVTSFFFFGQTSRQKNTFWNIRKLVIQKIFVLKVTGVVSQSCSLQSGLGMWECWEVFLFTPLAQELWTRTIEKCCSVHTTSTTEFTYCDFNASSELHADICS